MVPRSVTWFCPAIILLVKVAAAPSDLSPAIALIEIVYAPWSRPPVTAEPS